MAIYHLSVKTVSRSSGRSAVAASAYRTGSRLTNERDGVTHDYARRSGVEGSFVVAPEGAGWALDREALWNAAEAAEKRKDAKVAREYELALPHELDGAGREALARSFAAEVVARFGVAADVALHEPGREGDSRNHHAHVLTTTRAVTAAGLGAKTRALDVPASSGALVEGLREAWAGQVNRALEAAQSAERVDHRSLERQGRPDLVPTRHLGPGATALERQAARRADAAAERVQPQAGAGRVTMREPATRIGRHNAAAAERNGLLEAARGALGAAQAGLAALERAAADGARKVMALARGLGAAISADRAREREAAERERQDRDRRLAEKRERSRGGGRDL